MWVETRCKSTPYLLMKREYIFLLRERAKRGGHVPSVTRITLQGILFVLTFPGIMTLIKGYKGLFYRIRRILDLSFSIQ